MRTYLYILHTDLSVSVYVSISLTQKKMKQHIYSIWKSKRSTAKSQFDLNKCETKCFSKRIIVHINFYIQFKRRRKPMRRTWNFNGIWICIEMCVCVCVNTTTFCTETTIWYYMKWENSGNISLHCVVWWSITHTHTLTYTARVNRA